MTGPGPSQRILLALQEARARLEAAERAAHEPIAVVGIGCRFPGADGPEGFWRLLLEGRDATGPIPASRYPVEALHSPEPATPGRVGARDGAFLDGIEGFDAAFFGIPPREADSMDPQQRLLLEVAWEALEHAGQAPDRLRGSRAGVYVGITRNDYGQRFLRGPLDALTAWHATGNGLCYGPGRLAHLLDLRGPNLAVDTACSSSLLAVHLACQSLRAGECSLALAGGCHLHLSPGVAVMLSMSRALAPDGRCKAFDAAADGFGQGEGCGVVVLRRLSDAEAHGDRVLALIRGSAVNHDGHSSGLTVPNGAAQEAVIREALARARVRPEAISYVEAHGTGTRLGDPIEVEALAAVLCRDRAPGGPPLLLGSVKTNIGHLEAAAGIAGLIKAVLALQHGTVPPHLHLREPNPAIPWDTLPIRIPTAPLPWPRGEAQRLAGVSAFGMSGTNAHVVLEEAPEPAPAPAGPERPLHIVALSARTPAALRETARRLAAQLAGPAPPPLPDLAFTANVGRSHLAARVGLVCRDAAELAGGLEAVAAGRTAPGMLAEAEAAGPVFLFSGQGSQRRGMGRELYRTQPVFRRVIERCEAVLGPEFGASLPDILFGEDTGDTRLGQTRYAQPALFALELALAELWRSWGVVPRAVLGHSLGEYAAACVAGVFPLEEGLRLVAERGRLMGALPGGRMAAVSVPEAEAWAAIRRHGEAVAVAAVNGAAEVVLSGPEAPLRAVLAGLAAGGAGVRMLEVSHAFHSPMMEPAMAPLAAAAARLRPAPPRIPLGANLTGGFHAAAPDAEYWAGHLRRPVRFAEGLEALARRGHRVFLEIGPGGALLGLAGRHLAGHDPVLLPSLLPGREAWRSLLDSLARLCTLGLPVDWEGFDRPYARRRVALPTTPFERRRHWIEDAPATPAAPQAASAYRLAWEEQPPLPPAPAPHAPARWLLLADPGGLGEQLARLIGARGDSCVRVEQGPGLVRHSATRWAVDPASLEDLGRLLAAVAVPGIRILHLWGCEPAAATEPEAGVLLAAQARSCTGLLHLVQALAAAPGPARLWLVTRGTGGASPGLAGAALAAMGRVVALEHPELWGGMIDLPGEPGGEDAAALLREVESGGAEDQLLLRGGRRLAARLRVLEPPVAPPIRLRPDATYLVTGGLGALGLRVAGWMVERGARHLLLLGRGDPSPAALDAIAALRRGGATVLARRADVAEAGELRRALAEAGSALPPLRGVVHAAGLFGHRPLRELDAAELHAVLRPKLAGAWNLHRLTAGMGLDLFLLFSSAAALWGSKGQVHYAAANGFLDALAGYRRGLGLPGLSIAWGPWAGGGMAGEAARGQLARIGVRSLEPAAALAAMERQLGAGPPQLAIADVDWARLHELYSLGRERRLLSHLLPAAQGVEPGPAAEPGPLVPDTAHLSPPERRDWLVAHLQHAVAELLATGEAAPPDPEAGFVGLGLDSLMAVELKARLSREFRAPLPATLAFDHPNIRALAAHLATEVLGWETEAPPPAPAPRPEPEAPPAGSLAAKLARLESLVREVQAP